MKMRTTIHCMKERAKYAFFLHETIFNRRNLCVFQLMVQLKLGSCDSSCKIFK